MKRVQSSISSYFTGPSQKNSKTANENVTTGRMDSNSQPQQNSQVDSNEQGPYNPELQANDSLSEAIVGGCIDSGCFAKWRDIRDLGPYTQERLHIDSAFINGIKAKPAKKLNDKISRHGKCQSHIKCIEILQR